MDALAPLIIFAVLMAAVFVVTAPLRRARNDPTRAEDERERAREELDTAKEAKYREIRDADMDHRTGKLSDEDFRVVDRELRAEAVELLRRLDELAD